MTLAKHVSKKMFNQQLDKIFQITLPELHDRTSQLRTLTILENRAINLVVNKLNADLLQLSAFKWDTEQEKKAKLNAIREDESRVRTWEEQARKAANAGSSWTHEWATPSYHQFELGPAYYQLQTINSIGWHGF
jgi:hypothetical protein